MARTWRAPSENIIMRAPAPSLAFFGPTTFALAVVCVLTIILFFLGCFFALLCNLFIRAPRVIDL